MMRQPLLREIREIRCEFRGLFFQWFGDLSR